MAATNLRWNVVVNQLNLPANVAAYSEGPHMNKVILLVDDDPAIRMFLAVLLKEEGLDVAEAADGAEAVTWLCTHQPALVILDLQLPRVTGEEVLRDVQDHYGARVPVITMTAENRRGNEMRARGVARHLSKPFMLDDMLAFRPYRPSRHHGDRGVDGHLALFHGAPYRSSRDLITRITARHSTIGRLPLRRLNALLRFGDACGTATTGSPADRSGRG